ncbi:outer membrane lipoprotein carrier protein LolA [Methylobacter sp. YRD-M1]|uniref:outer membrane lipoprotein carrier protein LolA n=1 Tax=Methylobacter sp. YRD-M1 TaxID=2911520 RepID=UPI00227A69B1|nr:outer membrane lipoprotein carrier protein LolA [Methylobacter sp. YRD-M1]WAK02118.1 outer membrane lipoprotein carrier protein LolA [Methylobacter sp. YRD-M1]
MIYLKALVLFLLTANVCMADELLDQIHDRLTKASITRGAFEQTKQLKVLRKPLISNGTFIYDKSRGIAWKTLSPVPSLLLISDTRLWTEQGEQPVPAAFGKVFQAMLGADLSQLATAFDITGTVRKIAWQVSLVPKDEMMKKVISRMQLSGDHELRMLEIFESNGNSSTLHFQNIIHPDRLTAGEEADFAHLSP